MGLIETIGGLSIVTIATLWAVVRLTLYELQVEGEIRLIDRATEIYQLFLLAFLLWLYGPGLAQWAINVWVYLTGFV